MERPGVIAEAIRDRLVAADHGLVRGPDLDQAPLPTMAITPPMVMAIKKMATMIIASITESNTGSEECCI